jgi:hypothetical protein
MSTTTADTTTSVRAGLARLLEWLTHHPAIPVTFVSYADDANAELCVPAGGFERLATTADVADALTGSTITITDPAGKRLTRLTITGTIPADNPPTHSTRRDRPSLEVLVETNVYDHARARLLASLGAPPDPTVRSWTVTAQHVRGLLDAAAVRT